MITRVQCGVRLETKMLKVLKALAEYLDVSLGELLEIVVLWSFEGAPAFSKGTLKRIADLKRVYDLDWRAEDASAVLFSQTRPRRAVSGAGKRKKAR